MSLPQPPAPPPPHHHHPFSQLWLVTVCFFHCLSFLCLYSLPQPAHLQASTLALQETCWQRGRSWFLHLQLPDADSPCCQSDILCLAFPRSSSFTALCLYHRGKPHTFNQPQLCECAKSKNVTKGRKLSYSLMQIFLTLIAFFAKPCGLRRGGQHTC